MRAMEVGLQSHAKALGHLFRHSEKVACSSLWLYLSSQDVLKLRRHRLVDPRHFCYGCFETIVIVFNTLARLGRFRSTSDQSHQQGSRHSANQIGGETGSRS